LLLKARDPTSVTQKIKIKLKREMNNIKNSRKSTQKVSRKLKENKNSGLQDNTHFQAIGCS